MQPEQTVTLDAEESRRLRAARLERVGRWVLPVAIMCLAVFLWDRVVVWNEIPHYILPRPADVVRAFVEDWQLLLSSLLVTLKITGLGLVNLWIALVELADLVGGRLARTPPHDA